jgi:hypothetical protein
MNQLGTSIHEVSSRFTEILGVSVSLSSGFIFGMSLFQAISGTLQIISLIVTIVVGIFTAIHIYNKTKILKKTGKNPE